MRIGWGSVDELLAPARERRRADQIGREEALFLGPSHYSIGLQAADLVVASTLASSGGQLGDASRWYKQLQPRFARHPATGQLDGVGFKVFPGRIKGAEEPASKLFTA